MNIKEKKNWTKKNKTRLPHFLHPVTRAWGMGNNFFQIWDCDPKNSNEKIVTKNPGSAPPAPQWNVPIEMLLMKCSTPIIQTVECSHRDNRDCGAGW